MSRGSRPSTTARGSRRNAPRRRGAGLAAVALAAGALACGDEGRPRQGPRPEAGLPRTGEPAPARRDGAPEAGSAGSAPDAPRAIDAGPPDPGPPLERLRAVLAAALADGRGRAWSRQGRLGPEELTNDFATRTEAGVEAFSVVDADGYEGHAKCNLFAFEMAYRAGLRVPVVSRVRGWTYPGPTATARMVEAAPGPGGWARRVDGEELVGLRAALAEGRALLALGVAGRGRQGHFGLVEDLHALARAPDRSVVAIEYTGWEANVDGDHHRRRRWGTGRFARILLLELLDPAPGEAQVVVVGPPPDLPTPTDAARLDPGALARASANPRRGDMSAFPDGGRILEIPPPDLPVAHGLLGRDTVFGNVVDVGRVLDAAEPPPRPPAAPPSRDDPSPIDVGRVLESVRR